jgi:Family of unknown function (DUF6069)
MTYPMRPPEPERGHERGTVPRRPPPRVDAGQLWAGGFATAVVAALVAIAGILICRWLFGIPILAPRHDGAWGDASTGWYAVCAAAIALASTALMYLLALAAPRPNAFFGWIIGLATLVAVVFPFSTTAALSEKVATAAVNLVIGFAIGSLLGGVAAWATRAPVPPRGAPGDYEPVSTPPDRQRDPWR